MNDHYLRYLARTCASRSRNPRRGEASPSAPFPDRPAQETEAGGQGPDGGLLGSRGRARSRLSESPMRTIRASARRLPAASFCRKPDGAHLRSMVVRPVRGSSRGWTGEPRASRRGSFLCQQQSMGQAKEPGDALARNETAACSWREWPATHYRPDGKGRGNRFHPG